MKVADNRSRLVVGTGVDENINSKYMTKKNRDNMDNNTSSFYRNEPYRDDPGDTYGGMHTVRGDGYGGGGHSSDHHFLKGESVETVKQFRRQRNHDHVQSHNYEPDESEVWRAYEAQKHFRNRGHWWTTGKRRSMIRWVLTFIVGVLQAIIAFLCNVATRYLSRVKYDHVNDLLRQSMNFNDNDNNSNSNNNQGDEFIVDYSTEEGIYDLGDEHTKAHWYNFGGSPFLAFLFYQTIFAAMATLFVWIEPVCGGSGIPEIKCYLNGIDIPRITRIKTLICKVVGVTFSVAAGFPVGKEGPMVHSGSVVASSVSQGRTKCWGVDTSFSKFSDFRNDREKRDFVACGAAAGVTSAFGAPIGGVLFALEEGASYWNTKLTWRTFYCAMVTLFTLFAIRNLDTFWGKANMDQLFSFGEFNSLSGEGSNYKIWELLIFMVIGCLGGLIGAVFNAANEHLTIWRMKFINSSKKRRAMEVIILSLVVSTVSYLMPTLWNRCTPRPVDMNAWSNQEKNLVEELVSFKCKPKTEYNEVATLIFTDADTAIKQLFHFQEDGTNNSRTFSSAALVIFFLPYIALATFVYGIAIPSGLFVPSLLSGAAFGRLFGHLLQKLDNNNGTFADSGTYALMGAAAVLGGMARMTISLTVILLEATGDMQYVLPLMTTLMCARFTGNVFNEGLYDIHIMLKNIPFMEPDVPSISEKHEIVAGQVMSTDVKCLRPVEKVGNVYDLLRHCEHANFPIVDMTSGGTLYGTVSRSTLCTLLKRRAFAPVESFHGYNEKGDETLGPKRLSPLVQWDTIERVYPRYPKIEDIRLRAGDKDCWLDLRPYANTAPYTINESASIERTYRLFRTLGLRFLCVTNYNNQVVGIITRKDLVHDSLENCLLRGRNAHAFLEDEEQRALT